MITLKLQITDTAIRRHAADPMVRELNDSRHPLRLRYLDDRKRGSWYLVQSRQGRKQWRKLGQWPDLTSKILLAKLPTLIGEVAVDPDADTTVTGWVTVGQLLHWYGGRVATDRQLSRKRRDDIASSLRCHLIPLLEDLPLDSLDLSHLDEMFYRPLQAVYELASVKAWFGVLKAAVTQAERLQKVRRGLLEGITLGSFTQAKIVPKRGKLRPAHLPVLLANLPDYTPQALMLMLMMLLTGSRIGETRQARWEHIESDLWWIPPESNKSRREHRLPMTPVLRRVLDWWSTQRSSVYLFPAGRHRGLNRGEASKLIQSLGQGEWTAHDLRKLARTCWADLGVDYMVGELLLNHALSKLDQTYILTHADNQKRAALELYHEWLMGQGLEVLLEGAERKT